LFIKRMNLHLRDFLFMDKTALRIGIVLD